MIRAALSTMRDGGCEAARRVGSTLAAGAVLRRCDAIVQSSEDRRLHRALMLANNLRVLLVSDPKTDKSAASMSVQVGHLSDPDDVAGLAHFCEHMLFMGTKKFPDESEYTKFLNDHGGSSNAFTSTDETTYFFDVAPDHFRGALDRFSQFFVSPLFDADSTEREMNAVHSEHEKNVANDAWRVQQVERRTCRTGHPHCKFGTGCRETLNVPDVRERLVQFHRSWYSAGIMSLVMVGRETLDQLEEIAVEMFTEVVDRQVEAPVWSEHPCGPDQLKTLLRVVPVKDLRRLKVEFPVPDPMPMYRTRPADYLAHLIGHEGPGSLYAELRRRGWVNSLSSGSSAPVRGYSFFFLSVDLTDEGEQHTDAVIELMFQCLALLRQQKSQQWVFDECRRLREMAFRFKDIERPINYASSLSSTAFYYPAEEVLKSVYIMDTYDAGVIDETLALLTPENARVVQIGKSLEPQCDLTERWYGVKHNISSIPEETLKRWGSLEPHPDIRLPERNQFIAEDLDLVERDAESAVEGSKPRLLVNTPLTRLWFKQDDVYRLPKAILRCELFNPLVYCDPHMQNAASMFTQLVTDALNDYAYSASVAGLGYALFASRYGISLQLSGFSHKLHILLEKVMDTMVDFRVDRDRFAVLKEDYVRSLRNVAAEQPFRQAGGRVSAVVQEKYWDHEALLEAVDDLTVEDVERLFPLMLRQLQLECLMEGNLTPERCVGLMNTIETRLKSKFGSRPLPPPLLALDRETILDDGKCYIVRSNNAIHATSCVELYLQCGLTTLRQRVLLDLLVQVFNEPCFDQLRTKEQLGYIAMCMARRSVSAQGLRVLVQSDRPPEYVDARIEAFLENMHAELRDMDAEQFELHKTALRTRKLERPKSLREAFSMDWAEVGARRYCFNREQHEVEELATVYLKELLDFYESHISHDGSGRRKLAAHILSTQCQDLNPALPEGLKPHPADCVEGVVIEDVAAFKRQHAQFPHVPPALDVSPPAPSQAKL